MLSENYIKKELNKEIGVGVIFSAIGCSLCFCAFVVGR